MRQHLCRRLTSYTIHQPAMNSPDSIQRHLVDLLTNVNVKELDLSPYSRKALKRVLDAAEYYLEIYRESLERVLAHCNKFPAQMTIVDYGGGHGLLSILAKQLGFGQVIYIDTNADAIHTVEVMEKYLGAGPDVVLQGDAPELEEWCHREEVLPDAVLGMDVIEHVYVLDELFAAMHNISPTMLMLFTTASNPKNKRIVRKLHKSMRRDEEGHLGKKGFWQLRRDYVKKLYPDMPARQLDYWADYTRGLAYKDIGRAVESQSPNLLFDEYNTCDPETGSWTERILPIENYRQLLSPYGYKLTVLPGMYNTHRGGPKAWISRCYNRRISRAPKDDPQKRREYCRLEKALKIAPFIYLKIFRPSI